MTLHVGNQIIPADFPELKRLVWNRDPLRSIAAEEVFALYERNWRFVDQDHSDRARGRAHRRAWAANWSRFQAEVTRFVERPPIVSRLA